MVPVTSGALHDHLCWVSVARIGVTKCREKHFNITGTPMAEEPWCSQPQLWERLTKLDRDNSALISKDAHKDSGFVVFALLWSSFFQGSPIHWFILSVLLRLLTMSLSKGTTCLHPETVHPRGANKRQLTGVIYIHQQTIVHEHAASSSLSPPHCSIPQLTPTTEQNYFCHWSGMSFWSWQIPTDLRYSDLVLVSLCWLPW